MAWVAPAERGGAAVPAPLGGRRGDAPDRDAWDVIRRDRVQPIVVRLRPVGVAARPPDDSGDSMRAVRRTLVALGVAGTCVLLPVTAADAHTASLRRDCDSVVLRLTSFRASAQVPNTVEVRRNGVRIDLVRFRATGTEKVYRESSPDPVTYEVGWTRTGPDRHTGR